jgi:hypothetical protein
LHLHAENFIEHVKHCIFLTYILDCYIEHAKHCIFLNLHIKAFFETPTRNLLVAKKYNDLTLGMGLTN